MSGENQNVPFVLPEGVALGVPLVGFAQYDTMKTVQGWSKTRSLRSPKEKTGKVSFHE